MKSVRFDNCTSPRGCRHFWAVASALISTAILCSPSLTQQAVPAGNDLSELSLEQLMNIQVTTASKKAQKISQTPAAVFVITHQEIQDYGYRTLAEALQRVAGLYVTSDRNYSYLGVRGFGRPGDLNTRILLLIDGHRVNDPMYDQAFVGEDDPLDIQSVERIEIVKGPGSALWGTNALLAVVNLITRKAADIRGSNFTQDLGTNAGTKSFFEFGNSGTENLQIAGSVSVVKNDGLSSIYYPEFDDPSTNNGIAKDLDGESAERGYITSSYKNLRLTLNSSSRKKFVPTGSYGATFDVENYTLDKRRFAELCYEPDSSDAATGAWMARVYVDESSFKGISPFYWEPIGTDITIRSYGQSKWWGSEARYSRSLSPKLSTVFGLEYQNVYAMHILTDVIAPAPSPVTNTESSFDLFSGYGQAEYQMNDALKLIAGTRIDDYSTVGKAWSPRTALLYTPRPGTTLKALYGTAFRAPNGYEQQDLFGIGVSLVPEKIKTTELVWEQELGGNSRLVTSLFRFDLDHIINEVETEEGATFFTNAGAVRSQGLEVQLESCYSSGVTSYLGFTVGSSRDSETRQRTVNSPNLMASAGAYVPISGTRYYVTPELLVLDNRKTLAGNTIGASAVANLSFGTKTASKFAVSLGVYNLFNTALYTPGAPEHLQDKIEQNGREYRLQTSYRF